MKRFTPLIAGLAAALLVALSVTSPGLADTPPRQIAMGVSEPTWYDINSVDTVTAELGGHQPAIWSLWSDWGSTDPTYGTAPFPTAVANGLYAKGIVPMVYWEPVDPSYSGFDCANWSVKTILDGSHDAYIHAWAQAAAAYGHTVILRLAHEMNGYWYVWGNGVCSGNSAKNFRQAWKHVWNIFHSEGATNVKFLYSVINTAYVKADYPGSAYVDYLGLTTLDWGTKKKWKSLTTLMSPTMTMLRSLSKTKPIIGAEIAAGNNPKCAKCNKAAFFSQGYPAAVALWPQLTAMIYLDYDMRGVGQDDWRLQSPQSGLDAYKALLDNGTPGNQTEFQGTFPHS